MIISITNTHGPILTTSIKVLGTKVKERNFVPHGGLYVGNESHYVRNSLIIGIAGNATTKDAACTFNDPEMIAKRTAIEIDTDLLSPKSKKIIQAVSTLTGIAVVPAIDESHNL